MNTARLSLSLAIMLSLALSSPALAQQNLPPGQAMVEDCPAEAGVSDLNTHSIFDNSNYMIRGDAGDGVGYIRGFQTLAAFQPIVVSPDEFIFWVSPRGIVTYNSGDFGANLGAGVRWLEPTSQRILGAGFWYDHDQNGYGTNNDSVRNSKYDQLGGSGEWLGNMFDLRINAYVPTNSNVHVVAQSFTPSSSPFFVGNNIAVGQNTFIINNALKGGDFEGGGALPGIGDLGIRAYAGGYYYEGQFTGGGLYGVRGRLEALITQNLWGTVIVTHDRIFGTNVSAAGTIYLGSGEQPRFFGRIPMTTRLYQQMERQYRVAVQQSVQTDLALALRAGGTGGSGGPIGTPIFVDHVDNTAAAGGNGTVEHPFNMLPTTTPKNVDIIFVNRGDGTSTGMNQGITLNNFQRLLGDGVQHQFTSLQGTFTLPGFTPGVLPTITNVNADGTGVRIASNNEVSGFNITNPGGYGISNMINAGTPPASVITNFNINNVNVTGAGNNPGANPSPDGLHLQQAIGLGIVNTSTFNSNLGSGIVISNSQPPLAATDKLTLNVGGTTANNVTANSNGASGITLAANGTEIDPNFNNVTANLNHGDGINITANDNGAVGAVINGTFTNVTANQNSVFPVIGSGFDIRSQASIVNLTVSKSTFNGNGLNGVFINLDPAVTIAPASVFNATFDQITANNNGPNAALPDGNGFRYLSDNGATGGSIANPIVISRSTFDGNFANGLSFTTLGGSTLNILLVNNNTTISNNHLDGVLFNNTDSTVNATLLNNVISNNLGKGVDIISTGTGVSPSTFNLVAGGYLTQDTNGNGVLDPGEDLITIPSLNHPPQTPEVIVNNGIIDREGNTITGNVGAGIAMTLTGQAGGSASIIGNFIQGTKAPTVATPPYVGQGIDIRLTGVPGDTANLSTVFIDDNTIGSLTNPLLGNAGGGIVVFANQSSSIGSLQIGNPLSSNPGNIIANNGSVATPNGGISITNQGQAVINTSGPIEIENNTINNNIGNGVSLTPGNIAGVTGSYDLQNNTISNNTLNGLLLTNSPTNDPSNTANQPVILTATNNTFVNNTLNGALITNTNGMQLNATFHTNTFTSNGQMGIQVDDNASITNLTVGDATTVALGNTFNANHGAGIGYFAQGEPTPITAISAVHIFNNTILGTQAGSVAVPPGGVPAGYGIDVALSNTPGILNNQRTFDLQINNNLIGTNGTTITANVSDGIHIELHQLAMLSNPTINANTIAGNGGNGISISATDSLTTVTAVAGGTMNNNIVTGNSGNGVLFTNSANTLDNWSLTGNQFNSNTLSGLFANNSGNAVFNLTTSGNQFNLNTGATADGLHAVTTGASTFNLTSTTDTFNGNTNDGIELVASNTSVMGTPTPITLTGATITGNHANGVQMTTNDTATLNYVMTGSTVSGTTVGDGVNITTNGASLMNVTIGAATAAVQTDPYDTFITNNAMNGIHVTTNSTALFTINVLNAQIDNNPGGFGYLATHNNGTVTGTFKQDSISSNGSGGVSLAFFGPASTTLTNYPGGYEFLGVADPTAGKTNTINGNGGTGFSLVTTPGAVSTENVLLIFTNNVIGSNNSTSGPATPNMFINVGTGSKVTADIQVNTFSGNVTDFTTTSFTSAPIVAATFDLRFTGNTGTLVAPGTGAGVNNSFNVEDTYVGGTTSRLNDTNTFPNTLPSIQAAFTAGGYTLVTSPDPAFSPPMPAFTLTPP